MKVAVQDLVLVNRVENVPSSNIGSFCPLTMGNTFSYPFYCLGIFSFSVMCIMVLVVE